MELDVELAVNHEPQAKKSFSVQQFFKNAAEVWASSPHLRSKLDFVTNYSCCNCSKLVGKSRGGTPFCRTMKIVFSKNYSLHLFH